jgi:hypothetical protein
MQGQVIKPKESSFLSMINGREKNEVQPKTIYLA